MQGMLPVLATIERRNPDLSRHLRRTASSVVLNVAEIIDTSARVSLIHASIKHIGARIPWMRA
jgi:hypothetical protein